jgi:hypothetical protein
MSKIVRALMSRSRLSSQEWGKRKAEGDFEEGPRMDDGRDSSAKQDDGNEAGRGDGADPESERWRVIRDLHPRRDDGVNGGSGVPHSQRDHELRRQLNSLDEFS